MFISMTITYLVLAIVTGILGFGVLSGDTGWIARAAFYIFTVAFGISFLMSGQPPTSGKDDRTLPKRGASHL